MKKCKYCQSEIDQKAKICPHCRKKQSHANIILFTIVSLIIIGIISMYFITNYFIDGVDSSYNNLAFKNKVSSFTTDYLKNCGELEEVASDVKSYWYLNIFFEDDDINKTIQKALDNNKDKIDNQKSNHELMKETYKEIISSKCNINYCDDIKKAVKEAYKIYDDFYDLAINPSGSYDEYVENFKKIDSEASDYYEKLSDLLDLFNIQ